MRARVVVVAVVAATLTFALASCSSPNSRDAGPVTGGDLIGNAGFKQLAISTWDKGTGWTAHITGLPASTKRPAGHQGKVDVLFAGTGFFGRVAVLVGRDTTGSERLVLEHDDSAGNGTTSLQLFTDVPAPSTQGVTLAIVLQTIHTATTVSQANVVSPALSDVEVIVLPRKGAPTPTASFGVKGQQSKTEGRIAIVGARDAPVPANATPSIRAGDQAGGHVVTVRADFCPVCG